MRISNIAGSNNLTLPVQQRAITRLAELKEVGKTHFQKGENGEWHEIPADLPIAGALDKATALRKVNENEYRITYKTYKTKKDENGIPRPVKELVGSKQAGEMTKIVEYTVTEVFKPRKPFTTKRESYIGNPVQEAHKDPAYREQRKQIITGGQEEEVPPEEVSKS